MTDDYVDIIFRGDIIIGHNIEEVKQRLAQLFNTDDKASIDALFSGAAVPLKRHLEKATAVKYEAALRKAGIQVELVAVAVGAAVVSRVAQPEAKTEQAVSLAESTELKSTDIGNTEAESTEVGNTEVENTTDYSLSLAPVGTEVLRPTERQRPAVVEIDTEQLSLRPQQGDLLDASEKSHFVPLEVDLSAWSLV